MFQVMEHPSEGRVRYVRPATRFGETPATVRLPAPNLGEHTEAILADLGYSSAEIAVFRSKGIAKMVESTN